MSIENAIVKLNELKEDSMTPKNLKEKLQSVIDVLQCKEESSIRINKALDILDNISNENNIQSYTRTQLWNIVSMLESI